MKRVLFLAIYFLSLILFISRINAYSTSLDIRDLLNEGLDENYSRIQELSFELTPSEKTVLYDDFEMNPTGPILLNFLPFGPGSSNQGDEEGAKTIRKRGRYTMGALGGAYLGLGIMALAAYTMESGEVSLSETEVTILAAACFVPFASLWGYNKVYKIVRPIKYSRQYNTKLKEALDMNETLTLIPAAGETLEPDESIPTSEEAVKGKPKNIYSLGGYLSYLFINSDDSEFASNFIMADLFCLGARMSCSRIYPAGFTLILPVSLAYVKGQSSEFINNTLTDEYPCFGYNIRSDMYIGYTTTKSKESMFTYGLGPGYLLSRTGSDDFKSAGNYLCFSLMVDYRRDPDRSASPGISLLYGVGTSQMQTSESAANGWEKVHGKGSISYISLSVNFTRSR